MRTGLSMGGGVTGGLVGLVLMPHFVPLCASAAPKCVCALCAFQGGYAGQPEITKISLTGELLAQI